MIIDTDVLIGYLRGNTLAKKIITDNIPFKISVVTYLELIHGVYNKDELKKIQKQLKKWSVEILQINETISTYAMFLVENYHLSNNLELADAMIAATVLEANEILLTANDKHYKFVPNIQIKKFRNTDQENNKKYALE